MFSLKNSPVKEREAQLLVFMPSPYILAQVCPVFTRWSFPLLFPSICSQSICGDLRSVIMLTVHICVCVLGVNSLCQSLSANPSIPSSLVHLDLSGNVLRGDDMQVQTQSLYPILEPLSHLIDQNGSVLCL